MVKGKIRAGGSGLKRHKKSFLIPTTLTSALTCRSSTELSAGWERRLYALIFEVREDKEGEYYDLVTVWKTAKQEQQLYEEHS